MNEEKTDYDLNILCYDDLGFYKKMKVEGVMKKR